MTKTRFRCYEIESCYVALAVARSARRPHESHADPWWRRLWSALTGKSAAAAAILLALSLAVSVAPASAVSAKDFIDAKWNGVDGQGLRLYYVSGAVDGLTMAGVGCPDTSRYGEIIAWTEAEIYKAGAMDSDELLVLYVVKGLAAHGCRRP